MKLQPLIRQDIQAIHDASARILSEMGVYFGSMRALELFASAGADVDFEHNIVRMPETLVDEKVSLSSHRFALWDREGRNRVDLQDGVVRGHNVGGCVRVYDLELGLARDATRDDLQRLTTLIDGLENIHVCRPAVYPAQFPSQLRDIHVAATILQYTTKPYGVSAYSPANLAVILEVLSAIAGDLDRLCAKPFIWGSVCPRSPLWYSESTADILIRYAELGLPVAVAPCPVAGGTSPVTLAGTLAQLNAEFLAALVLVHIVRPGIDLKYTARPMPMNLNTGNATFGAIEMGMMSAGVVALSQRYGVCSDVYGLGTRAKMPDAQAAYEKALNGLLVALAGADLIAAAGLLEDALTSSAEQMVIDDEILGQVFRAVRGIDVTEETIGFAAVQRAGHGGNLLTDEHTLAHMRRQHFVPRAGVLNARGGSSVTALEAARDRAAAILAVHEAPLLDAKTVAEIDRIVDTATRKG